MVFKPYEYDTITLSFERDNLTEETFFKGIKRNREKLARNGVLQKRGEERTR